MMPHTPRSQVVVAAVAAAACWRYSCFVVKDEKHLL